MTTDISTQVRNYEGNNSFILKMKDVISKYGSLTSGQRSAVEKIFNESSKTIIRKMNIPVVGDTIKIGRSIGVGLKEKYNLKFNPILLDVTKILGVSDKAIHFSAKLTIKRGSVCTCCMRTLTDEFSMLTGLGKTCASHVGVPYITDPSQAEKFREEYMKRVDEIGEMDFWVPKKQIKMWEGKLKGFVEMSKHWLPRK